MQGGIPRLKPFSIPLLSYGFRPFFLGAGIWACVAMVLWIGLLTGAWSFANAYGPLAWHAHEFLFGYVSAVLTGFLLTAIPNWTGRMPLQGWPLLGLVILWLAGRAAMLMTDQIGNLPAMAIDIAYLAVLTAAIVREIAAGKNWRNLKVAALVGLIVVANVTFHLEVLWAGAPDYGMRLAIAAIIALIMLVGGRVTPSFTHNWLARTGDPKRPAPLGRLDFVSIGITAVALASWVAAPNWQGTALLLFAGALAQAIRLSRWAGARTWREPIVFVLHIGYAFIPIGALILGISILWPATISQTGALHAWTTGAIGMMTLAVMTRATLGHTGHSIATSPSTLVIYGGILIAAFARITAGFEPAIEILYLSAFGWLVAYVGFVAVYGPMLVRARQT
jgi:uncharacterized protein involved in response to NO